MGNQIVANAGPTLIFLYGAASLAVSVVFVIIAWRAMRAHERIAAALEQLQGR